MIEAKTIRAVRPDITDTSGFALITSIGPGSTARLTGTFSSQDIEIDIFSVFLSSGSSHSSGFGLQFTFQCVEAVVFFVPFEFCAELLIVQQPSCILLPEFGERYRELCDLAIIVSMCPCVQETQDFLCVP
jgi:hypothetical protein